MPIRYERLPNPSQYNREDELEAAFDDSEDEGESTSLDHDREQRPLVAREPSHPSTASYDFERVDYDYPPPGSPPGSSSAATLPNAVQGNTNGLIPSSPAERPRLPQPNSSSWFRRLIPFSSGISSARRLRGRVGGGAENDGVFANLMSKPTRARRIEDEDGIHFVPEETQSEPPPSYAAAQADAVPSYWETTIHAPAGGDVEGELVVDSLPTGSLFSFLWSMLVSVAFNFLGFVLTYLLHTTHAAKYGSRAGLGITLIQYGWALRTRAENLDPYDADSFPSPPQSSSALPTELPAAATSAWGNDSLSQMIQPAETYVLGESAAAWLSFSLMTIGWFLFLSSVLGFWRVKRWERGVLRAAPPVEHSTQPTDTDNTVSLGFAFPGLFIREGLGLTGTRQPDEEEGQGGERFVVQEIDRQRQIAEFRINDVQLHRNLRAAGLI